MSSGRSQASSKYRQGSVLSLQPNAAPDNFPTGCKLSGSASEEDAIVDILRKDLRDGLTLPTCCDRARNPGVAEGFSIEQGLA
jgi:hypothetical protein